MTIHWKTAAMVGVLLTCGCVLGGPGAATGPAKPGAGQAPPGKAGAAAEPAAVDPVAAEAAVRRRLAGRINKIDFDDVQLCDVIQFLRDVSGQNIHVKWGALTLGGVKPDTPVNIHLRDVTVEKALRVILDDAGGSAGGGSRLDYLVEEGVVLVSTSAELNSELLLRTHRVADLVERLWRRSNRDFAPWQRDPFDLREQLRPPARPVERSIPATQPGFRDTSRCDRYPPGSRNEAMAELTETLTEAVMSSNCRTSDHPVGCLISVGDTVVFVALRNDHKTVEDVLAQLREDKGVGVSLGLALVRVGDEEKAAGLRKLATESKAVDRDLREGARRGEWRLERCEVEALRLGQPAVLRRMEQTVLPSAAGAEAVAPPVVVTTGYEVGVLPLSQDGGRLRVSVACSAGWPAGPGVDRPKAPPGVRSVRRVIETPLPATGAAVVQAAPMDAEGGGLLLVIWQERK